MEDKDKEQLIKEKIQKHFEFGLAVHISKKDKEWLNGYIKEKPSADFFFLEEFKKGKVMVFFLEIHDVDTLEKKEEGRW